MVSFYKNLNFIISKFLEFYYYVNIFNNNKMFKTSKNTMITFKLNQNLCNKNDANIYFEKYFDSRDIKKYSFEEVFNLKSRVINSNDLILNNGYCYYITFNSYVRKRTKIFIDKINLNESIQYNNLLSSQVIVNNSNDKYNRINDII